MAFVRKMQKGDKSPTLYTMYGKLYDFDELLRQADLGLSEYLSTLKRGLKDQEKFIEAYSNIMNGIKDGTITFKDGRYNDSLGRYTNSSGKNKNKDHYGLMANYIFRKLGKALEYKAPEDKNKIKWNGSTGVSTALIRNLYNSDNGNILDFIDVDSLDPESNKRGTTKRTQKLQLAFLYVLNNFDTLFTGYSDSDKASATADINEAIKALQDGRIDAGDYLALSKAASGLSYRDMFTDSSVLIPSLLASLLASLLLQLALQPDQPSASYTPQTNFAQWIQLNYPLFTGTLSPSRSLMSPRKYGPGAINTLNSAINNLSELDLTRMVRSLIADRKYVFNNEPFIRQSFNNQNYGFDNLFGLNQILTAMRYKGLLMPMSLDNPNLFYIPGTATKRQTAWVWDSANHLISEKSFHDIPYWRNKIASEYAGSVSPSATGQYNQYPEYAQFMQKGGIVKALAGTNSNIFFDKDDFGYNTYLNKIWQLDGILDWMKGHYTGDNATSNYADFVKNNVNGRYNAKINDYKNGLRYTGSDAVRTFNTTYQNNGDTPNYILFGNSADEYSNRKNGVAYSLNGFNRPKKALGTGDAYNEDKSKAYIDNALGAQTYSRVASLTDPEIKTGGFGGWGDYWKSQGNTGAYYYIADGDTSGRGLWIPTSDTTLNGYQPFSNPEPVTPTTPGTPATETPLEKKSSNINPILVNPKLPIDMGTTLARFAPDLLGASRLGLSLRTNNRISEIMRKAINPVLIDTYERYSPITGAYQEMLLRNKLGADVLSRSTRPFTSDASLALAGQLDANRLANELQYQGFLADDKEIKRTAADALMRQEDNMARRSDVANKNRISIHSANRERAELEATRRKLNWQSVDNFLRGMEERARLRYDTDLERRNLFRIQTEADDIERRYLEAVTPAVLQVQTWMRGDGYGQPILNMPGYTDYENLMREMSNWRKALLYQSHAKVYGYNYSNPYLSKTPDFIKSSYNFKQGGKLVPRKCF